MTELSIKVNIAGRIYPLTINDHEEEGIRKAAKLLNERVKEHENNFAVRDKQDLLAMCALQFANESESALNLTRTQASSLVDQLNEIDQTLAGMLTKESSGRK